MSSMSSCAQLLISLQLLSYCVCSAVEKASELDDFLLAGLEEDNVDYFDKDELDDLYLFFVK
eukprot:15135230-Ditylum_brightwellii.AAC.1